MGSLLDEYRKRHGIDGIWPVNEGSLFFDLNKKPSLVVITSSFGKNLDVCPACQDNKDAIILEIFRTYRYPHCTQRVTHTHMPPDANLLQYVGKHIDKGNQFVPYISSGERDQEGWLWRFFLRSEPFKQIAEWQEFLKHQKTACQDPKLKWLEQAMWTMQNAPDRYRTFYMNVYSNCLINRRYILSN